jgi:hypothetical protein
MELKKVSLLLLSILALAGASFMTGCGEKSDTDKAADAIEEAGENAADAIKDIAK